MTSIDQAFQNIPILFSLNQKKLSPIPNLIQDSPFLFNLWNNNNKIDKKMSLSESLSKMNILESKREKISADLRQTDKSINIRNINQTEKENNKSKFEEKNNEILENMSEHFFESMENHEEKKEDCNQNENNFILDEIIKIDDYIGQIPDLSKEELDISHCFDKEINAELNFNENLYKMNDAIFNKLESKEEREKTRKFIMKALEHEINKLEGHVDRAEKELLVEDKKVKQIDSELEIMNNDLKRLIFEKESNYLMEKIDNTLKKPIEADYGRTENFSNNKKEKINENLDEIFKNNENLFHEISQFYENLQGNSEILEESQEVNSNTNYENKQKITNYKSKQEKLKRINSENADILLSKAETLLKELKINKNKKLHSVLGGKLRKNTKIKILNKENLNLSIQKEQKLLKKDKKVEFRPIRTKK